jgi:hypothetical protein
MRWTVVVVLLVALPGCGWKEESEKWRRTAENFKTQLAAASATLDQTQKDLKEQSEKWKTQSQKLGDAMIDASAKLDPLEIRKIYLDNRDLGAVAHQLEARLASAVPEKGDVVIANVQLRFDVTGHKGRSVIRAYLDYDMAPFLESELAATEPVLPVSYDIATRFYDEILKANRGHARESESSFFPADDEARDVITAKLADTQFSARRVEIDARYKHAVTSEFGAYLKRGNFAAPQGAVKPVFLARQFRTPGRHEVRIQVEPKTPVWEVRLTVTEVAKGTDDKIVKYWELNPNTTPDLKNIPRMVFWIRYRPDDQK